MQGMRGPLGMQLQGLPCMAQTCRLPLALPALPRGHVARPWRIRSVGQGLARAPIARPGVACQTRGEAARAAAVADPSAVRFGLRPGAARSPPGGPISRARCRPSRPRNRSARAAVWIASRSSEAAPVGYLAWLGGGLGACGALALCCSARRFMISACWPVAWLMRTHAIKNTPMAIKPTPSVAWVS